MLRFVLQGDCDEIAALDCRIFIQYKNSHAIFAFDMRAYRPSGFWIIVDGVLDGVFGADARVVRDGINDFNDLRCVGTSGVFSGSFSRCSSVRTEL